MDVSKLVDMANFAWLAKEYLESEARIRNNPLLVHDNAVVFVQNETISYLRVEHPAKTDKLEKLLKAATPEQFYDILLALKTTWQESVEELIKGICFEIPSSFDNITEVLHHQYGLQYGEWFDYVLTFTNVSSAQPAHQNFTVSPHNGILWYISPKPDWKLTAGAGRTIKWEFCGKLTGHAFLNDKQAKEFM